MRLASTPVKSRLPRRVKREFSCANLGDNVHKDLDLGKENKFEIIRLLKYISTHTSICMLNANVFKHQNQSLLESSLVTHVGESTRDTDACKYSQYYILYSCSDPVIILKLCQLRQKRVKTDPDLCTPCLCFQERLGFGKKSLKKKKAV